MKQLLVLLLAAVALLAGSCTDKPRPPPPELDEQHVITVEGTTVRYNGRVIPWNTPPEQWQEVFGPRSRKVRGISVWDELGVYLYDNDSSHPAKDYPVSSLTILFGRTQKSKLTRTEPDFWPKKTFRGRLMVDGALIHSGSNVNQINSEKKDPPFMPGYSRGIYSYDSSGFYIRLDFGYDRTLTEFSISPPADAAPPESAE